MTKTDIFSGFLGAGKTTLSRKLIAEGYKNEKLVLIETEFGEIAIDGGFLQDAGVQITEMNSGCICCTLVGDFTEALKKVIETYAPDRILIEPSGVGKLSDVAAAVERVDGIEIGAKVTLVDAGKCRLYARNFGEFFNDQVENADMIVLSRTGIASEEKTLAAVELLRGLNHDAALITTPWEKISGGQILEEMEQRSLQREMEELLHEPHDHKDHEHEHHHDHEDHDHGEERDHMHEHHHDHDHEEHEHEHEHHHEHHHDHDHEHDHEHDHDHHHADEIFDSWGVETARKYSESELKDILGTLEDEERFGAVLRAKGIVDSNDGDWIHFDYVPGEIDIRRGTASVTGRICVIGAEIRESALKELFRIG